MIIRDDHRHVKSGLEEEEDVVVVVFFVLELAS